MRGLIGAVVGAGGANGIQSEDAVLIVLLQRINVTCVRVHDGSDGLACIVRVVQTEGMAEFMEYNSAEILGISSKRTCIMRVPGERLIEDDVGIGKIPSASDLFVVASGEGDGIAELLIVASNKAPARAVDMIRTVARLSGDISRLVLQSRAYRIPIVHRRFGIVVVGPAKIEGERLAGDVPYYVLTGALILENFPVGSLSGVGERRG